MLSSWGRALHFLNLSGNYHRSVKFGILVKMQLILDANTNMLIFSFSQIPCLCTVSHFMHLYQMHHKCSILKIYQLNLTSPELFLTMPILGHARKPHCQFYCFPICPVLSLPQISALVRKSHDHQPPVPLFLITSNGNSLFVDFFVTSYKNV